MGISEETANALGNTVVRVIKLFSSLRQQATKVHAGADVSSYPILFHLAQGPRRVSSLADCVHSDVSTVSRQVSALAAHGLVDKLPDPEDRRASMLSLTPSGAEVIEALQRQRSLWFQHMLEDWEQHDIEELQRLLERFSVSVERSKDGLLALQQDLTAAATAPGSAAGATGGVTAAPPPAPKEH